MKVGILTYHRSVNYGAFLQAFCLCSKINSIPGYQAEIIDFTMQKEEDRRHVGSFAKHPLKMPYYYRLIRTFEKSANLLPLSGNRIVTDDSELFRKSVYGKYDIIVCGSDEIWNTGNYRGFPNPYWLIGDYGCRKVSYAASSRVNFDAVPYRNQVLDALESFEYIGVRDNTTYNNISKLHPDNVQLNCDPTFLYPLKGDRDNGKRLLNDKFHVNVNKKVIGVMCHDAQIANYIKGLYPGVELITLYEYNSNAHRNSTVNPFEWVDILSALDFVVTHFFHCACFAINNDVPFYAVEIRDCQKEDSKVYDLLNRMQLTDRFSHGFHQAYSTGLLKEKMDAALLRGEKETYKEEVKKIQSLSYGFLEFLNSYNK